MAEWHGIDLRGRRMRHPPWGKVGNAFPISNRTVKMLFFAYTERGGDYGALIALLNQHVPSPEYRFVPAELLIAKRAYSLEFQWYCFTFAQLLLDDSNFHYSLNIDVPLSEEHSILEQGPMKFPPWRKIREGPQPGYLSITNMRSMFLYAEQAAPVAPFAGAVTDTEARQLIASEALKYLNAYAPERFIVDRSFFDTEEILISGEYLYYLSSLMMILHNDSHFIFNSIYYGSIHGNALARSIFLQPFLDPAQGFEQWQERTNRVYDMRVKRRGATLRVDIDTSRIENIGMFGQYREYCLRGIQQATSAGYKAFMELSSGNPVRLRLIRDARDPNRFSIRLNWKSSFFSSRILCFGTAGAGIALWLSFLVPSDLKVFTLHFVATASAAIISAGFAAGRQNRNMMRTRFAAIRTVIDDQLARLKATADALQRERDGLEEKVLIRTRELENALAQIRELDLAKTNFIANVSHELRTPLTLLSVPLEGIRSGLYGPRLPPEHPIFSIIQRNVDRLSVRIDQLLDLTRLDLGTMPYFPQPLSLVSYCRNLLVELRPLAEQKGLMLSLDNRTGYSELQIDADRDLLETALLNILNNALKHTERGGITIRIGPGTAANSIALAVEDTGSGFPDAEREKIFQRFTQLGDCSDRRQSGAGLGLALAKEVACRHGWLLNAHGVPGTGACFTFVIPLSSVQSALSGTELPVLAADLLKSPDTGSSTIHPESVFAHGVEKRDIIILVEDDPEMESVLRTLLEPSWGLRCFRGGREALTALDDEPSADLIICDVMMPGMSGFEFRASLLKKERLKGIPFIFLTAFADTREKNLGLEQGALDYIRKPFTVKELILKVRNILATQRISYQQALDDSNAVSRLLRIANVSETVKLEELPFLSDANRARYGITPAEARVIALLRQGYQDKEIAARLSVSTRTVSSHLSRLYRKTGAGNRLELLNRLIPTRNETPLR